MVVYDFDKTIYKGNATIDFYIHCLKRRPKIIKYLFVHIIWFFKRKLRLCNITETKEHFFEFLKEIPEIELEIEVFWDEHKHKIKKFYKKQQRDTDLIISASPSFLLRPICKELGIKNLIASEIDLYTGKFIGNNKYCYREEKVKYFKKYHPNNNIEQFFSDSNSDVYLKKIAKQSFKVHGEKILIWD